MVTWQLMTWPAGDDDVAAGDDEVAMVTWQLVADDVAADGVAAP